MKKLLLISILFISTIVSYAQTIIDNIVYNITSPTEVEIQYSPPETTGNIVIPETVTINNNEYSVISIKDYAFTVTRLTSVVLPPLSVSS